MGRRELFIKIHRPIIKLASKIPSKDNLILMGNHPNKLDPLLLSCLSPDIRFATQEKDKAYRFVKTVDCNLTSTQLAHMANAFISLLEQNVMCLFPEGEINNEEELKEFLPGALVLAKRSGAKIMPFAITGSYNIFKKEPLRINVGEPFIPIGMNERELDTYLRNKIYELKKK